MEQRSPLPTPNQNRILQILPESDLALLQPDLEPLKLKKDHVCIEAFTPIEHVYFLDGGLGSTIIPDETKGTSEIGMQGYEGFIGVPVVLGADRSPHKVFMQVGGPVRRIGVAPFQRALERSVTLRDVMLRYAQVFLIQTGETAYVNTRFKLEERLARWLLMAADRLGPELSLTHEYLSYMLGVRRPGVTTALHILEGEKLITSTRGLVIVRDRTGLEAMAGKSYGVPEAEYERLIAPLRQSAGRPAGG